MEKLYNLLCNYGKSKIYKGYLTKYETYDKITIMIYVGYVNVYILENNTCVILKNISQKYSQLINILEKRKNNDMIKIIDAANMLLLMKSN